MEPLVEPFHFPTHLPLLSTISYGGLDFQVLASLHYQLPNCVVMMYQLMGPAGMRYFEPELDKPGERALWLTEIPALEIDTPPPRIIDWQGRSYLQVWGGSALVRCEGDASPKTPLTVWLWRYRAAGDEYLQIEQNEANIRMFAGPSVHQSMIEARPVT
jgi:hypothetical protein